MSLDDVGYVWSVAFGEYLISERRTHSTSPHDGKDDLYDWRHNMDCTKNLTQSNLDNNMCLEIGCILRMWLLIQLICVREAQ